MTERELIELFKSETNMTNHDIERHIEAGVFAYQNNEIGRQAFINDFLSGLGELEEAEEAWECMDVLGAYRVDFVE